MLETSRLGGWTALLIALLFGPCVSARGEGEDRAATDSREVDAEELPPLHREGEPYRTPRAGEGFRTELFGEEVRVPPRDRRSVAAFDIGAAFTAPGADENEVLPFASLYFWEHPDDSTLLRAVVVGFYNEIFFSKSPDALKPFELVATFENYTLPVPAGELIDGKILDDEKIYWGHVRPGLGFGYRRQVAPGNQDNMLALDLTFQPAFLYFGRTSDTSQAFEVPEDTFEPRGVLSLRYDALTRNLLELPHVGLAAGADLVYGYRASWDAWGTPGTDRYYPASSGRDYLLFTGYVFGTTGVPFVESERHRLIGSVYGGIGDGVDRFSSPRVGGGPDPRGEEYGALWRPFLGGAVIDEFHPEEYVIGTVAYRFELMFASYVGVGASLAYLDRERRKSDGSIETEKDLLTAVGARITTGFLGETRLQIGYSYNFDVIRRGNDGGHEVFFHISKDF